MSTPDPMQTVEQEVLSEAVAIDEQLAQADPTPPAVTHGQKEALANQIWKANGAVENDPLTLNNWLEAEILLASQSTQPPPTE